MKKSFKELDIIEGKTHTLTRLPQPLQIKDGKQLRRERRAKENKHLKAIAKQINLSVK